MREVDFTKKRLQQEFEDKLEVEQQNKRQLERRVSLVEGAEDCVQEGLGGAPCHPVNVPRLAGPGAIEKC